MNHVDLSAELPMLELMGMIDLDATSIISGVIFLVMLLLLNQLLFKPYLAITHERARLTTGALSSADETVLKADQVLADYEAKMREARAEAVSIREGLRGDATDEQLRILSAARDQAATSLAAHRATLAAQVATAEAQVDVRAAVLSKAIVERVTA